MVSLKAGNWVALRDHVRSGRAKLGLTQRQLAEKAGVSFATVQSIERAEPRTRIPDSVPRIEIALGWPPGTAARIVEETMPRRLSREEVQAIREELKSGVLSEKTKRVVLARLLDEAEPTDEW